MNCLEDECVAYVYAYEYAYLSPMGWTCIYSRCSTSRMVTRIRSHGIFFVIIGIGFGKGYKKSSFSYSFLSFLLLLLPFILSFFLSSFSPHLILPFPFPSAQTLSILFFSSSPLFHLFPFLLLPFSFPPLFHLFPSRFPSLFSS